MEELEARLRSALHTETPMMNEATLHAGITRRVRRRSRRRATGALLLLGLALLGAQLRFRHADHPSVDARRLPKRAGPPFATYLPKPLHRTDRALAAESARLRAALAVHPTLDDERAALLYSLGETQRDAGDATAIDTWRSIFDEPRFTNVDRRASALLEAALLVYDDGDRALPYLQRVLAEAPESSAAVFAAVGRADALFEEGELDRALALYELAAHHPESSIYRYAESKIGWVHDNRHERTEAVRAFTLAASGDPSDPVVAESKKALSRP